MEATKRKPGRPRKNPVVEKPQKEESFAPADEGPTAENVVDPLRKVGAKGRKTAPAASVIDDYYLDERQVIVNKAKAALGSESEGMDFLYGTSNPQIARTLELEGWVPVVTDEGDWRHRDDPLLMRPKGRSDAMKVQASKVAQAQLKNEIRQAAQNKDEM